MQEFENLTDRELLEAINYNIYQNLNTNRDIWNYVKRRERKRESTRENILIALLLLRLLAVIGIGVLAIIGIVTAVGGVL